MARAAQGPEKGSRYWTVLLRLGPGWPDQEQVKVFQTEGTA